MTMLSDFMVPTLETVNSFMMELEDARRTLPFMDWQAEVKKSPIIRAWRFYLTLDPYTRWALIKPRGYPGDATLMDFAYEHASVRQHIEEAGAVGQAIYRITAGATQSQSARIRLQLLQQRIISWAEKRDRFSVISFASGHARELENINPDAANSINKFIAIDSDPVSLANARASAEHIEFIGSHKNVIKDDLTTLLPAELVYSLGLFDYLADAYAVEVLGKMLSVTAIGSECIVANLAPTAANLGYCEAIMDWWMIVRDDSQMLAIGQAAVNKTKIVGKIEVQRHGCFNYLIIRKIGA